MAHHLILYQVGPGLGIPSLSPFCIQQQAVLKFANFRFDIASCSAANIDKLPSLKDGFSLVARDQIADYLQTQRKINLNALLSGPQLADITAFTTMVEDICYDATMYFWWMDKRNYAEVTYGAFTRDLSFPQSSIWPWQARRRIEALLRAKDMLSEETIVNRLKHCYEALSARLGSAPYFFGDLPSSLDAVVFGHLCCHLFPVFPNSKLQDTLKQYPRLVHFIHTVRETHFNGFNDIPPHNPVFKPLLPASLHSKSKPAVSPALSSEEEEARRSSRNFVVLMGVSVAGYLLFSDLIGGKWFKATGEDAVDEDEWE